MPDRPSPTRRILAWAGIVAPVCGAITVAVTMVIDIRTRLAENTTKTEASYETLAPAITELQGIVDDLNNDMDEKLEYCVDLERRLIRVETYVELIGSSSRLPDPDDMEVEAADVPPPPPRANARRTQRAVPDELNRAADFQQKRQELRCDPGDPLCGLEQKTP